MSNGLALESTVGTFHFTLGCLLELAWRHDASSTCRYNIETSSVDVSKHSFMLINQQKLKELKKDGECYDVCEEHYVHLGPIQSPLHEVLSTVAANRLCRGIFTLQITVLHIQYSV